MEKELDIPRIEQDTTNWCWAACTQMVIGYTNNNYLSQVQIVAVMYDVPVVLVSVTNPDCNKPANDKEIETVFDEYAVNWEYVRRALSYEELKTEIDNNRPIEIGIKWAKGGMHAVVIFGYQTNGRSIQNVLIRDPSKDTAPLVIVPYANLIDGKYGGFGEGAWVDTFWKLKKISIDPGGGNQPEENFFLRLIQRLAAFFRSLLRIK